MSADSDVSRRTWLAAERTWLAWWRTGVAVGAVAITVGRLLPGLTHQPRWPYRLLGLGYCVLSVAILLLGANRQQRAAKALREGSFDELTTPVVSWLTAGGVVLALASTAIVAAGF